jgi:hypothetical protein
MAVWSKGWYLASQEKLQTLSSTSLAVPWGRYSGSKCLFYAFSVEKSFEGSTCGPTVHKSIASSGSSSLDKNLQLRPLVASYLQCLILATSCSRIVSDPLVFQSKPKRSWRCILLVEHLPSMCEALGSISNTTKNKFVEHLTSKHEALS